MPYPAAVSHYSAMLHPREWIGSGKQRREIAMAQADRILIVGGGIAGLALATAVRRQGLAAEVVERSPTWPVVGAGIALHANGGRPLPPPRPRPPPPPAAPRLPPRGVFCPPRAPPALPPPPP